MPPTSVLTSKRGFTFIEMSVTIVVILVLAALIIPDVVRMTEANERRQFFSSLWRFAAGAREVAIQQKKTIVLNLDSNNSQFQLLAQDDSLTLANAPGQGGPQNGGQNTIPSNALNPNQNTNSSNDPINTLAIPSGIDTGSFSSNGSDTTSGDWQISFYADGTSDGGGMEVTDDGKTRALQVKKDGSVSVIDGQLPDQSTDQWPAGDYEKRADTTSS